MKHNFTLEGPAFRLRPITDNDALLVLELRGNVELNRYLHATSPSLEDQLTWFARYYERPDDYYFVIEQKNTGIPEGVISIYDANHEEGYAEWGRWILKPGSLAAVESVWLMYRCVFELLKLQRIFCRTVAENSQVVSFHDSCGITERRTLDGHFDLNGRVVDVVEHQVDCEMWSNIGPRLERLAQLTARRLLHE